MSDYSWATNRRGEPKALSIYEASAALTAAMYRLGAEMAKALRLQGLADRWDRGQREMDERRRKWRRDLMGRHYDGL